MTAFALDLRSVRDGLGVAGRVSDIPATACVRGVWFTMVTDYVNKLGRTEAATLRSALPSRRRVPFLNYSLREYVEELATAAVIVDPKDPNEGMRVIWRMAATAYTSTAFGRSLLRLFKPEPQRSLTWLAEHRDHFCNYGRWQAIHHTDTYTTMEMENEYIWLGQAHRGGAEGLLRACGVTGTVEAEALGPYDGRLHIRWEPQRSS